jgi:hypothetical protein
MQKRFYPSSKTSILLDSMTYSTPGTWEGGGRAVSLLPYVQNIPRGLLDSVGLQGFPWEPAANLNEANNGTATNYLRINLLIELARGVGVQDTWVNSGTFSVAYSGQDGRQVTISPAQRQVLLDSVVSQLKVAQTAGLNISMHLFAEDKSRVAEGVNWSYWPNNQYATSDATAIFKDFTSKLQSNHIPLWLFDAMD